MSPDLCSPMTNCASFSTLFSPKLHDETEEPLSDLQEFSSAIMCKSISPHAFTFSAEMLGPNRTSSFETLGSFVKRKKKSSPYGSYFPGTFHSVEAVRKRTLSRATRKGQSISSRTGRIGRRSLQPRFHRSLEPTLASVLIFHALWGFDQRNNWIFEVLFPKCLSCFVSSFAVVFSQILFFSHHFPHSSPMRLLFHNLPPLHI